MLAHLGVQNLSPFLELLLVGLVGPL